MSEFLKLNKSNCKNCYKCIRHCPVKSIRFSGNQAHIVNDECILCGQCFVVCPQNAKEIIDETEIVRVFLSGSDPVIASIAPSFTAYFEGVGISSMQEALVNLGFSLAEETAIGATMVKREYDKLLEKGDQDIIISSCCHSVNLLIGKHYPELAKYLAPVVSPMQAHCLDIKRRYPNAKTVFIGPCLAKKDEGNKGAVDAVITFKELSTMLKSDKIIVENRMDENIESRARLFPTVGGILKTMECSNKSYTYLTIDGVDSCKSALEDIAAGNIGRCFIEMSACAGSCIGGPVMEKYHNSPVRHFRAVTNYAGEKDFDVDLPTDGSLSKNRTYIGCAKSIPGENEITNILHQMGKFIPEDELNCGTCGYDTCRAKAAAVLQGKAEISMCLPFLMEKSERFSNNILDNTPNGILVVNENLEVQRLNAAAMKMLNINSQSDVLGEPAVRIMDPLPFIDVLENGKQVNGLSSFYAEYNKYIELTIVHDKTSHILISILRDVTEQENERKKKEVLGRQTAAIADKVVEKQMRIVQEIASLLGETAAETKIALTKLKESMPYGDDK